MLCEPVKVTTNSAISYGCWQLGHEHLIAHRDLLAAFFLLHTAVGDCAMNKLGTFGQAPGRLVALGTGTGIGTMLPYYNAKIAATTKRPLTLSWPN
jgi:hypothetical protein